MIAQDHAAASAATDIDRQLKKSSAIATKWNTRSPRKNVGAVIALIDKAPQSDFTDPMKIATTNSGYVHQVPRDA